MDEHHKINTKYKNLIKVNKTPPIYLFNNFLTNNECDLLIKESINNLNESSVIEHINGQNVHKKNNNRDSESCYLDNKNNIKISKIIDKISKFAPIKHISKNKSDNKHVIIELLDDISRDLNNYDLEFRIQELESKFSRDLSETTFNELKELKKKQNIN